MKAIPTCCGASCPLPARSFSRPISANRPTRSSSTISRFWIRAKDSSGVSPIRAAPARSDPTTLEGLLEQALLNCAWHVFIATVEPTYLGTTRTGGANEKAVCRVSLTCCREAPLSVGGESGQGQRRLLVLRERC